MTVHRRCRLNAFAEGNQRFWRLQFYRLNDVMTAFRAVWNYWKTQAFIDICCKNGAFYRACSNCGR